MSSSARPRPASRANDGLSGADLRRPEVRLPRRALSLPAVGDAQRAEGPAQRRRARGRRRAGRGHEPASGLRAQPVRAAGGRARARTRPGFGLRHRRGRRPRPRRLGGDPPGGPVRLLQPRAPPAPGSGDGHRGPRLDQRHLPQRGAAHRTAAAAPRRPHPHRRLRVRLRGLDELMLRVADSFIKSDTGRQRRGNEDSAYARAPLFVIADGMGGAQAGEVASGMAVDTLAQGLPDGDGPVQDRLADRVHEANAAIYEKSRSSTERAGMGTTLTAAYVDADEAAIAHVGDSRAYLFRDGTLRRLTDDHSLVEEFRRQGKLTEEEARDHPQKSIITRALGPEPFVEVDRQTLPLRDGDVLLLCSDGLTTMITEDAVRDLLADGATLAEAGEALVNAANDAGGRDNITVVLVRVEQVDGGAGATASEATEQATGVGESAPTTAAVRAAVATAEREGVPRPVA